MEYINEFNVMPITFPDELFDDIAIAANEANLSFNEYVIKSLIMIINLKRLGLIDYN